jgi:hypothetical protein
MHSVHPPCRRPDTAAEGAGYSAAADATPIILGKVCWSAVGTASGGVSGRMGTGHQNRREKVACSTSLSSTAPGLRRIRANLGLASRDDWWLWSGKGGIAMLALLLV